MGKEPRDRNRLLRVGIGAGLLGGVAIALRYSLRPARRQPVPGDIFPEAFQTRVFDSSHGQMVYHTAGRGDPLVFLHNLFVGASSYEWSRVYPAFAESHRVIAPDLIGFGESERPLARIQAESQIRSLQELLLALCGRKPAVVVASGLGAGFAAVLASQHPELVRRLVLLMPTGLHEQGRRRVALRVRLLARTPFANRFAYANYLARRSTIQRWLEKYGFAEPGRVDDKTVDVHCAFAQQYHAENAILSLLSGGLDLDLEPRLASLPQQVHLLWADQSPFPPIQWARRCQSLIPACNLTILHDTSLLAALEAPETLAKVIREDLQGGFRILRAASEPPQPQAKTPPRNPARQ